MARPRQLNWINQAPSLKLKQVIFNSNKPKTGLLLNPLSGRVRKQLHRIRGLISGLPGIMFYEASCLTEINQALAEFINQDVELLVIVGGDGTVQASLNFYLSNTQAGKLPKVMIAAAGTTNMTAKDIGVVNSPLNTLRNLEMLLQGRLKATLAAKAVLKVSQDKQADIYGMFFGAGIIANGTKFFQKHVRITGITGEFASFLVVMNLALKMLRGRGSEYLSAIDAQIQQPHSSPLKLNCLLLFATTLDRLLFGLKPYWGKQAEPVHFTFIRSEPVKFWRSLLAIIVRRGGSLTQSDGYFSSNSRQISIKFDGDFIVDGEIFHADGHNGEIHLTATEPVTFIVA